MMVSSLQGKLLHNLVAIFQPQRVLEIGGFTGYSAIAMGSALAAKATLLSLELDPKHIEFAEKFVNEAQLQDKVKFRQGPAMDSLAYLGQTKPSNAKYDLIFLALDADKGGYIKYFDSILKYDLLSDRGIILADNVLFFGFVHKQAGHSDNQAEADKEKHESASENIKKTALKVHKFNQHVANDPRVESVSLPIFDGLTIIRKK
ncbi:O-methyltransferase [Parasitella parasitica]|nr:O-methyltransferase [Parasitella parasitica]